MKKLCIAPFTREWQACLRIEPSDYHVCSVASPSGICPNGVDASHMANRRLSGVNLANDLDAALETVDAVLIPPITNEFLSEYADLAGTICRCSHKELLDSRALEERIEKYNVDLFEGFDIRERLIQGAIQSVNVPVIYICSFFNNTDCFEILESLGRLLKNKGHSPVVITQNRVGSLYGNTVLQLDLIADFEKSVVALNEKICWIVKRSRADVLLIELPKPVADYSKYIHYDFGIGAYAVSKAVPPDGIVFCTALNLAAPDFIARVCESNSLRLGAAWWMAHVGNQVIKTDNEPEDRGFQICYAGEDDAREVAARLRDYSIPAFCGYSDRELEECLYRRIEEDLFDAINMVIG